MSTHHQVSSHSNFQAYAGCDQHIIIKLGDHYTDRDRESGFSFEFERNEALNVKPSTMNCLYLIDISITHKRARQPTLDGTCEWVQSKAQNSEYRWAEKEGNRKKSFLVILIFNSSYILAETILGQDEA